MSDISDTEDTPNVPRPAPKPEVKHEDKPKPEALKESSAPAGPRSHHVDPAAPEAPPVPDKSYEEIAKEVAAGKWGEGRYQHDSLVAAGYSYVKVRAAVNRHMSNAP